MMSIPQEGESSPSVKEAAVSTELELEGDQDGAREGGQVVFRDSASDSFEDTDDAGTDAGKDLARLRADSPLYQTLEPPSKSDTELDVSNKDYKPAEYEAVTRQNRSQTQNQTRNETHRNQTQTQNVPIYHILEAPKKSISASEIYTNRLATERENNHKSDPHVYQVLQPVERPAQEYTKTTPEARRKYTISYPPTGVGSESTKGQSTLSAGYRDYRDGSSSTMKSGDQLDTKRHRLFKVVLVCLGILFLSVVTAIAIAGLVLALKNKTPAAGCQCEEEIQQLLEKTIENRNRLDALEEESEKIGENQAAIDEVRSRVIENEGGIQRITMTVNESIGELSATLDESIGNLVVIDPANCSTSVEVNCTVQSDGNECTTEQVNLHRPGEIVLNYACISMSDKLVATPITNLNNMSRRIKCHCSRENMNEQELKCGLMITRCHTQ